MQISRSHVWIPIVLSASMALAQAPFVTVTVDDEAHNYALTLDPNAGKIATFDAKATAAPLAALALKPNQSVTLDFPATPTHVAVYAVHGTEYRFCSQLPQATTLTFTPNQVPCGAKKLRTEGLLVATFGQQVFAAAIENRVAPDPGSDLGVALTLVDRWKDPAVTDEAGMVTEPDEGFRLHGGASAYYAISRLRSQKYRAVANLAFLDMDKEIDFEVGLGAGLMFRPDPDKTGQGFSVTIGVGYNLMLDDSRARPYTFVGIGYNKAKE